MDKNTLKTSHISFDKRALTMLPPRRQRSNKGDYGRVLCVCGCSGMSGAAYLAAKAAYRTGAGLAEVFTPEQNRIVLQTSLPEAIVMSYTDEYKKSDILPSLERADSIVIGCGIGVTPLSLVILSDLLHSVNPTLKPLVIDADAINLLSRNRSLLKYVSGAILTPHFMEASRLLEKPIETLLKNPEAAAYEIASKYGVICVMKDHETVISDGRANMYVNRSGNSGMATGGSGDVLSGILGGLLAQNAKSENRLTAIETTALGVYVHGLAGDAAAVKLGEYSLMASDIIEALPLVLRNTNQ